MTQSLAQLLTKFAPIALLVAKYNNTLTQELAQKNINYKKEFPCTIQELLLQYYFVPFERNAMNKKTNKKTFQLQNIVLQHNEGQHVLQDVQSVIVLKDSNTIKV